MKPHIIINGFVADFSVAVSGTEWVFSCCFYGTGELVLCLIAPNLEDQSTSKHQVAVYDILPPTIAIIGNAIGLRKLSAN